MTVIDNGGNAIKQETKMTRMQELGFAARKAELDFDAACQKHYSDARWGFYRAVKRGHVAPKELHEKCDKYLQSCREFYLYRDGENGLLSFSLRIQKNDDKPTTIPF